MGRCSVPSQTHSLGSSEPSGLTRPTPHVVAEAVPVVLPRQNELAGHAAQKHTRKQDSKGS